MRSVRKINEREYSSLFTENLGIKDLSDCAILNMDGSFAMTTDVVIENVHFSDDSNPKKIGMFSINVNLSDLASAGALPVAVLITAGIKKDTDRGYILEVVKGIKKALGRYNVKAIGGDTKESSVFFISVTAIGKIKRKLSRYGVNPGDLVCVTGYLGKTGMNYYKWMKTKNNIYINNILSIEPKILEGQILASNKHVSASMDLSDGLVESLNILGKLNNVGFVLDKKKIPVDPNAKRYSLKENIPLEQLYDFGGDYELLFTVGKKYVKNLQKRMDFHIIGYATNKTGVYYDDVIATDFGFKHFQ
ncbi:MAG: thiamine-phosphate kinase [Thermoplasmata archaeon]